MSGLKAKTQSPHRCPCGEMLVDVREAGGGLRRGCKVCERLVLDDVVMQIWRTA